MSPRKRKAAVLAAALLLALALGPAARQLALNTALRWAMAGCRPDRARLFLSWGANPDVRLDREYGDRPLHVLGRRGGIGDGPAGSFSWMLPGDLELARALIAAGAHVDAPNLHGETPLHLAASRGPGPGPPAVGHVELVKLLLQAGANPNARTPDGRTPLHYAEDPASARVLLDHGADVNARGPAGWTPLHRAAYEKSKEMVRLLLARGADRNAREKDGRTAADLAAKQHRADLAELLKARRP